MRTFPLALATMMILATGSGFAKSPHAPPGAAPGRVAWFDLTSSDLQLSQKFYGGLFGWTFAPLQGTDLAVEIVAGGEAIGTLRVAEGAVSPYNGVVYILVADIRDRCAEATRLGGTIPPGFPFDLSDGAGAVALVVDPAGHPVGMYSRTPLEAAAPAAP